MDLPNPGIEPRSPALQVASLPAELGGKIVEELSFSSDDGGNVKCSDTLEDSLVVS